MNDFLQDLLYVAYYLAMREKHKGDSGCPCICKPYGYESLCLRYH